MFTVIAAALLVISPLPLSSGSATRIEQKFFYAGADPSEIPEVEAAGGVYKLHGEKVDPFLAMKQAGFTAIRESCVRHDLRIRDHSSTVTEPSDAGPA